MNADCPFAEFVPAHESNYKAAARASFDKIVIHITDGHAKASGTAEMFATPKLERKPPVATSAHFVVGQAGEIVQCVRLKDVAYHCPGLNTAGVGVEHCARSPKEWNSKDPGMPPTADQYVASARLVAWLLRGAGLPCSRDVVLGHNEADPETTHKDCPSGAPWDWPRYMALVQAAYDRYAA